MKIQKAFINKYINENYTKNHSNHRRIMFYVNFKIPERASYVSVIKIYLPYHRAEQQLTIIKSTLRVSIIFTEIQ